MTKTKKIHEILFLEEWNTHAYITEDGGVHVQLRSGQFQTKEQWFEENKDGGWNNEFMNERLGLFDYLLNKYKHLQL